MEDLEESPIEPSIQPDNETVTAVSPRKIAANRQNALKSTGPKTPRGKAYSRRNAIKHGLFARLSMDFFLLGENSREYDELLADLCNDYQPVGRAEKFEVECITLCLWRLKRAARYETATTKVAMRDLARREIERQESHCAKLSEEEDALILQLESAKSELEDNGVISEERKGKMFAARNGFESMWPILESQAEVLIKEYPHWEISETFTVEDRSCVLAMYTLEIAIAFVKDLRHCRTEYVMGTAIDSHVIPGPEVLDRLLRYQTATERSLHRAIDRLERLQQRRKGEPVPPSVNVRLTQ
jgi:hypothetical protein